MRINGTEVESVNEDWLVLPRGKTNIVFHGKAIQDYEPFKLLCPIPTPPKILKKDKMVDDPEDPGYRDQLVDYQLKRHAYMTIKTLEPSNIEWKQVDITKPNTWRFWADELAEIFSIVEQQQILAFVQDVNGLNQNKIDAARADFLRGLAEARKAS